MVGRIPEAADRRGMARWFQAVLRDRAMPYWCRTADPVHGGYRLGDRHGGRPEPAPRKHLVTQCRMLYALSLAHRQGLDPSGDCLRAAEIGFRFLTTRMLDQVHGGMVAVTAEDGSVLDDRKLLLGHAYAIYGLVEYHRATADPLPLALAVETFRLVEERLRYETWGGWVEHADREFHPLRYTLPSTRGVVGIPELRCADATLHWMEALSELYDAAGDPGVGASLAEALDAGVSCFYPGGNPVAHQFRTREWRSLGGSRHETVSYGHNVEFAWLMLRAQEVLGRPADRRHFDLLMGHALRFAVDRERGGIFFGGPTQGPPSDRRKAWWVQAEMLAALCDRHRCWPTTSPEHDAVLDRLVEWIVSRHILPEDGIWLSVLDAEGRTLDPTKAGPWKGAYHEVRAITKYIGAFA